MPQWIWERWQWGGTPHSRTGATTTEMQSVYSTALADWADGFVPYPGHSLSRVLLLGRDAVGVFYSSNRLGCNLSSFVRSLLPWQKCSCRVSRDCRIHRLRLSREVRPPHPTSVLDMTLNNLMVRFQWCWSFMECKVPLYCHCSQVHPCPEW